MLSGMENMNRPAGGDPQDAQSTEQFWAMIPGPPGAPAGPAGLPGAPAGPAGGPSPSLRQHDARDRRRTLHWTVGLTAAAVLAAGGVVTGLSLGGGPSPTASSSAAGASTGLAAQAAALNSTLNSAGTPGTLALASASSGAGASSAAGTGQGGAAGATVGHPCLRDARAARRARLARLPRAARAARAATARCLGLRHRLVVAALLRGIDGQFTIRTRNGTRTLAFERGTVQSVSSSAIVVRASDGTTWTWDLVSNTVVREHGTRTQRSALATGQPVWVGGPVVSGGRDARLVVIRPPTAPPPASPAPAPSASSS
jgi:hypothetical protein